MKDHLLQILADRAPDERRNLGREYLQLYMLRLIAEAGLFPRLEFVGGTALRLLFALPRFSEDLDFSMSDQRAAADFDVRQFFTRLKRGIEASGYQVEVKASTTRPVVSAFYRFPRLPAEGGWTTVVITDNDRALAEELAAELATQVWTMRERFWEFESIPADEAVRRAVAAPRGLVILSDTGDSVFGGATGVN